MPKISVRRFHPLLVCVATIGFAATASAQKGRALPLAGTVVEADGRAFPILHCQGGDAVGEVPQAREADGHRHIRAVVFTPIVMQCEVEDAAPWIREAVAGRNVFNFSVAQVEADGKVANKLGVENAVLTRIEFPALDAASKDIYRIELTFQPSRTVYSAGGDVKASSSARARRLIASNFRVTVGDIDCSRVGSIGAFAITFGVQQASTGMARIRAGGVAAPQFGDLVLRLADGAAQSFFDWHRQAVIEQKADAKTVSASIELLAADMKTGVFRIDFTGVGIFACRRLPAESDRPAMAQPELYVEGVSIPK